MESIIHTDHNGLTVSAVQNQGDQQMLTGHQYHIYRDGKTTDILQTIQFQKGPVKDNGVNGATNEALLAILINRTNYLNGMFPCAENDAAIFHMKAALEALESRTRDRIQRNVEGQNKA